MPEQESRFRTRFYSADDKWTAQFFGGCAPAKALVSGRSLAGLVVGETRR
jgi:hypothetical protein